jgi:hypothetical protein
LQLQDGRLQVMTADDRIVPLYLALLAFHVAHVFEEVWGRFFLVNGVFGPGWYLAANWVLVSLPLVIFHFYLRGTRWAFTLTLVYSAAMILNGIAHNAAALLAGKYFDGFAGGITGIGLVRTGAPLFHRVWKTVRPGRADEPA